ncbi:hypothetical protein [Pseudonocardia abyssalis]|uniref:XapX domain-containing protein n=1 Tax=Pseudonocardia abyssalis TaxID=2792008 RepID=A0ABS6UNJ5_9PSEU|nr:hypothetical protein [Pseudonocardia abyssalis]MBW0118249.1 hypothetical protein [Pseudonocardia abyssalis]MBW0133823.1 hypothetical protein [Pseudonocardia abyssalis]
MRLGRVARECARPSSSTGVVLVGLVVGTRFVPLPPEAELATVAGLGVGLSFGIGALLVRVPGVARVV